MGSRTLALKGIVVLLGSVIGSSWTTADQFDAWALPGGARAGVVQGEGMNCELSLPDLTPKQEAVGGPWKGVVSLDLEGLVDGGATKVKAELIEPATGIVLAMATSDVKGKARKAPWSIIASSEHGPSANNAFDGDPGTQWHSRYGADRAEAPHWIGLEFAEPVAFSGISYLPRQGGFTNGVARRYRLEVREEGKINATEETSANRTTVYLLSLVQIT